MDLEINIPGHLDPIFKGSRTDTVGNEDTTAISLHVDNGAEKRSSPTTFGQVLSEEIVDGPQLIAKIDSMQAEFRRFKEVVISELKDIQSDLEVVRSAVVKQNQCRKPTCPYKIPISNDVDLDAAEVLLATEQGSFKNCLTLLENAERKRIAREVVNNALVESHKVTENIVDEISANFFRYAKDRNGGRSKRTKS
ncbi:unnamed protein product [Allacma fusca]|uniref:Uncharacterized protein n=1 Tax=Allacma fusca TaxID=39272 RepID=A0A8J2NXJ7_9HEXA|nr:unnamed protein product [Allacma fusca]